MSLTIKQIEDALIAANGNISCAAKSLKVTRAAVYDRIDKNDKLKLILDDARETRIDLAEDKLGDAVDKGEAWAVCFTLKTIGKSRGYVEKSEVDNTHRIILEDESE